MDLLIRLVAKIVVPLFFVGLAGSAFVVVISFIEDLKELVGDESSSSSGISSEHT